ncbi:hypothetical protein KR054_007722 [Drosophila jambulina]|nr:hypothetical protein KR054_007722 [Drosophila jambulina]
MAERHMMLLCIGLLSQLLMASAAGVPCSDDDVPVCAQSRQSGMHFLFGNECDLRKAQRGSLMDGPLYDVPLRSCLPSCDFECNAGYQPVCGFSSRTGQRRTFRSRCELLRASCLSGSDWLLQHWGVCPRLNTMPLIRQKAPQSQPKPRSQPEMQALPKPVPCTKVYRPVCAMYAGVKSTFSNECLVNAENIKTQRNWRIVSEGLCGEDSTKMKHSRKFKPKAKPKLEADRTKRSHEKSTQAEDFQIPEDAVEIYAPSTFHTEFISSTGAMVKSYSLPARKPYVVAPPKKKSKVQRGHGKGKTCVFGNEPVCATFKAESRTFASVCELMEYSQKVGNAWTISHDGACRRCDKPCPTVYQPICATRNGVHHTIINECYLERARCKDPASGKLLLISIQRKREFHLNLLAAWKFSYKGECQKSAGGATKTASVYKSRTSPLIPRILYGIQRRTTTAAPQSHIRRAAIKPTTKAPKVNRTFETTHPPSLEANNRKIRKIDMAAAGFNDFRESSGTSGMEYVPDSGEASWSTNDNWLVQKTLDNVKGIFSKKPASFKKASQYQWVKSGDSTRTTSTTASPLPPKEPAVAKILSLASTELLNLDIGNFANAYDDAAPELLFLLSTKQVNNVSSTTPVPSTTTPPRSTQPSTTELPTSWDDSSPSEESYSKGYTEDPEETTGSPTSEPTDSSTSSPAPYSTTEAEEMHSQTTGSESPTTLATDELPTTTQNADYTADESFSESSGQTSIYGLDKNSLIMRLLRARSNKNVLI